MELVNRTPFSAARLVLQDKEGGHLLVLLVKRTFAVAGRALRIADEQTRVNLGDTFHGEPGETSPALESDVAPRKLGTDVVVLGHAAPPRGRATELDVTLRVGPLSRTLRVFGDRVWSLTMGRATLSPPAPFERVPLLYERAFGGIDASAADPNDHEQEPKNPVGRGFVAKRTGASLDGRPLPNIEDPAALIRNPGDRPEPCGFGFIGRSWQPRASFAGTFDAGWAERRAPLLPDDFDERYYNGAHPRLVVMPHLTGNESVELVNASPGGRLRFELSGVPPRAAVTVGGKCEALETKLDTLILDGDALTLVEVWRGTRPLSDPDLARVRRISIAA